MDRVAASWAGVATLMPTALLTNVTLAHVKNPLMMLFLCQRMDPAGQALPTMRLAQAVGSELAAALMATVVMPHLTVVPVHVILEHVPRAPIFRHQVASAVLYIRATMSAKGPHLDRAVASMDTVEVAQTSAAEKSSHLYFYQRS